MPTSHTDTPHAIIRTRVIHAMTIPFTIQLVGTHPDRLDALLDEVTPLIASFLADLDATFSPFRDDSSVAAARRGDWSALLRRGPLDEHRAGPTDAEDRSIGLSAPATIDRSPTAFAEIYALCQQAKDLTDGHFDPMHAGVYDPTGIVKGWAVEQAYRRFLKPPLDTGRCDAAAIGGGGDIQTGVRDDRDFVWHIGVADPFDPQRTLRTITVRDAGIATSGTASRGEHITRTAHDLVQATVVDDHLTFADMWATTAISAGERTFRDLIARNDVARADVSAVLVRTDGTITTISKDRS